jgi:hypothetical protein
MEIFMKTKCRRRRDAETGCQKMEGRERNEANKQKKNTNKQIIL